jgi:hypothetical protein
MRTKLTAFGLIVAGLLLILSAVVPAHGQTVNMGREFVGVLDASGATQTAPVRIGAADPGTCDNAVRELFYNTSSNQLKVCNALNTWTGAGGTVLSYVNYKAAVCQDATATAGFSMAAANAATPACVTGANTNYGVAQFTEAATEDVQDRFFLPPTWTGTVDLTIKWRSTAVAGNVVWQVQTICVEDGETGDPAFNAASTVTDATKGVANQWNDATITGVTITGCAAGEELLFRFFRDPTHASDTLGATAEMISLLWTIRRTL